MGCPGVGRAWGWGEDEASGQDRVPVLAAEGCLILGLPHFPCQGLWPSAPALTKPMPPTSAHPSPAPTPNPQPRGPELSPSRGLWSGNDRRWGRRPRSQLCHRRGLWTDSSHRQPHWRTGPLAGVGSHREGRARQRGPCLGRKRRLRRGPGQPGPLGCFSCSPIQVL